ncbi:transmembrane protein 184C isoform X3 [Bactrocera neohumeralis]|uniref:transmembrane protein 184C isoform X3 n=1 Tax=Bactrocera tryoni TaxID=59916 RepID=UPI001A97CA50|nr:transmembrane protein 184C isoform X3 [Bactrocera tryoni]XP_050320892.1 transmembrane protein 184C isoform X3 [Bactrocera neohumeralis]
MCPINLRRFCEEWRIWIRPLLIVTYCIFLIIVVPLLIVNSVKDGFKRNDQLILIGGLFVLSAVPISIWHIIQHVIHFTKPILQKHIIRILWMVPIYALNAWIGLFFPKHSVYVDSLRECYEAYVIYNFMVYLLHYLNLGMDLEATMQYKPQVYHFFPLCCMRPWVMGREFIHNCKHGILQYTVVRPITAFISVICEICGVYGEGTFAGNVAFPYIVVINNISQFVAMYCLVLFYRANKEDLKPMKPIPKFLCIKAVVFFSFFQGVILFLLGYYQLLQKIITLGDNTNLASMLQNFLICIEMFIAAVAHIYSFPHYPFHINSPQYWNNPNHNWCRAFLSMMDISDMQQDVTEHLGVVSSSISRHFQGRNTYQPLSRGPRRSSSETEYLMSKREDGDSTTDGIVSDMPTTSSMIGDVMIVGGGGAVIQKAGNRAPHSASTKAPTATNITTAGTHSNFGINIQKREVHSREYSPQQLYGAPVPSGNSFLQARNIGGHSDSIPEADDDFVSLIGAGR